MICVAIAEDHAIVLAGLCRLLAMNHDIKITAAVRNGEQLLQSLRDKKVDLVITDLSMPGINGTQLILEIRRLLPTTPILALSMHKEGEVANRVLKAGATGYVTKDRDPEILLSAIRLCAKGGRYVDPEVAAEIIFHQGSDDNAQDQVSLSRREQEIFDRLVKGQAIVAIAEELGISPKTVSTHKFRLMEKLGIDNLSDLVRYAIKSGLTQG